MLRRKNGFTLIEIIVVVVILAVLLAVAVPAVLKYINIADEAKALTECDAIVTAAQKRVIDKYASLRIDDIVFNHEDHQWIENFVDEGGSLQGTITITNKEVTRLLYLASNDLYVLYENQQYQIVDESELTNTIEIQLNTSISHYTDMIKELYKSNAVKQYAGRNEVIEKLALNNEFEKVSDDLKKEVNSKSDLYWKPYYLQTTDNPSVVLFANDSKNTHGQWEASLVYVNGVIYKCDNSMNVADYYKYKTPQELQTYIESQSGYKKINE